MWRSRHVKDCHYITGFEQATQRTEYLKAALSSLGFDPRRLQIISVAGAEGEKFATEVQRFVDLLEKIGPITNDLEKTQKLATPKTQ